MKKIIVTIPAYNEEKSIGRVINDIKKNIKGDYKILVVNDGSKDKTSFIAEKKGAIVVNNKRHLGLAYTFKREMEECLKLNADIIVHTDADGQYPAFYIPELIKKIDEGYDLVLGGRFGGGIYKGSLTKKVGNIIFAKVFSNLLRIKIKDTTTGFRAFTSEVAKFPIINDFTYTQEQLIRAGKKKMAITEISIKTKKTRKSRLFSSPFNYAIKSWINIFRIYRDYAPIKFFGSIGLFLFLIGLIIGLYFVYLHFTSGISGHLGLLFLMIMCIFTGIQVILFGFLADMKK